MFLIPLRLKYRNSNRKLLRRSKIDPHFDMTASELTPRGTWVFQAGRFGSKSSHSGSGQKAKQGTGHRRRQGLGAVGR